MTPVQWRFAAWLAAVTAVPAGRPKDGFAPLAARSRGCLCTALSDRRLGQMAQLP
jgi:hypothetical protein